MRSANINREPDKRSRAEIKRSTGGRAIGRKQHEPASKETFKALKMQKALSSVSYRQRNTVKEQIADITTFDEFSLLPVIGDSIATQALAGLEELTPTPIQRLAITRLLGQKLGRRRRLSETKTEEMEQFLIAAETGSGKTLAYLLPVLDAIKKIEAIEAEEEARLVIEEEEKKKRDQYYVEPPPLTDQPHSTAGRPKAIILLPTSELVTQVGSVAKSLSHTVKFRSSQISSAYTARVIRSRLFGPSGIDLLICTPHLLSSIAESDPNILSRVSHLVIDEADSLLDRSFAPTTSAIIDKATPSLKQLIFCSATIPRSLDSYLRRRFPDMRRLVTPNLHAIPRRVQLSVVDVQGTPYQGNKNLACADTIWSIGKAAAEHAISHTTAENQVEKVEIKRILVFVNEREKTQEVASYLQSKGIDAVALNRDTPEERKSELLSSFTTLAPEKSSSSSWPSVTQTPSSFTPISSPTSTYKAVLPPPPPPPLPTPSPPRSLSSSSSSSLPSRTLTNTRVLVTTDLASRGIDTLAVRHVILYDVPHSTIDFIHRLGRTGRMGRRGRGIVLVGKDDRRDVVREVREGMFKGMALI